MLSGNVWCSSSPHQLHPSLSSLHFFQELSYCLCRRLHWVAQKPHSGLSQLRGFSMVLHSNMDSCRATLGVPNVHHTAHRNMQISARSELMHPGSNCWCVASFAFRREHKHRGISAVLSCETPGSVPWYTQCEVALFHQYILTEPWWATSRSPCTGPRVTKADHVCAEQP